MPLNTLSPSTEFATPPPTRARGSGFPRRPATLPGTRRSCLRATSPRQPRQRQPAGRGGGDRTRATRVTSTMRARSSPFRATGTCRRWTPWWVSTPPSPGKNSTANRPAVGSQGRELKLKWPSVNTPWMAPMRTLRKDTAARFQSGRALIGLALGDPLRALAGREPGYEGGVHPGGRRGRLPATLSVSCPHHHRRLKLIGNMRCVIGAHAKSSIALSGALFTDRDRLTGQVAGEIRCQKDDHVRYLKGLGRPLHGLLVDE